ncbi:hypothetical protein [Microvirga arabica]|uniref:hypothetical protein n=1 Tax=Microvirga arabica TaxID=1128671 RepID=UPI0019397323|nr:hypothetical protein [Microvirga arabica]MBM1174562.1 hypothetical protein [Microvirga arabica]
MELRPDRKPKPPSQEEKLEFLIDRMFPEILFEDLKEIERDVGKDLAFDKAVKRLIEEDEDSLTSWAARTTLDDFQKAFTRLSELRRMSDHDVDLLYKEQKEQDRQEQRAKAAAEDPQRFFNKPDAQANFDHWGRMEYWTVDEATALCLGKDPRQVNWASIRTLLDVSPFAARYRDIRVLIKRAAEIGEIGDQDRVYPERFLIWTEKRALDVPVELKAVQSNRADKRKHDEGTESKPEDEEINGRERNSLHFLVLGMAIRNYDFDPDYDPKSDPDCESGAFSAIEYDLGKAGLKLTVKPIRRHLVNAVANAKRLGHKPRKSKAPPAS